MRNCFFNWLFLLLIFFYLEVSCFYPGSFRASRREALQGGKRKLDGFEDLTTSNRFFSNRIQMAKLNTREQPLSRRVSKDVDFIPGNRAAPFKLPTLNGLIIYPGPVINQTTPVIFHAYNSSSAFLRCLWNCSDESIEDFLKQSPSNVHYVFMSSSTDAARDVLWMKSRLRSVMLKCFDSYDMNDRLHFVTTSFWKLKTEYDSWITDEMDEWKCQDHNCGIDQVIVQSTMSKDQNLLILPRLDARYDWLPSPFATFNNKTLPAKLIGDGCSITAVAKGVVAMVTEKNCDYFIKVQSMSKSGALGVLVIEDTSNFPSDMNCADADCNIPLNIPASVIPDNPFIHKYENITITFRNIPSENFFSAIDGDGLMAEFGWLLHPSLVYLAWQSQWFNYVSDLEKRLSKEALIINVFNHSVMHGDKGASIDVNLPPSKELQKYNSMELDFALSCPGSLDEECPHWDRTIQLFVCCNHSSALCGAELGRWISPFRRRIGRWITTVSQLVPLFELQNCTFTVTGALADEPWMPSLNLRFSQTTTDVVSRPIHVKRWINGSFTFDRNYKKRFEPLEIKPNEQKWNEVKIFSVITGHGSDENGCGEFCVTSHHFVVNKNIYNRTFSNAGSPLGCALQVSSGVEPNEHGTWLYGRNGWCDGQQVDPWVIDITSDLDPTGTNVITYFGWFKGSDPDPHQSPGIITINAYAIFYA